MTGDNKIMLALLLIGLLTLILYFAIAFITERKKRNKRTQARYKAYRGARREKETQQLKNINNAYFIALIYGGNK